MALLDVSTNQNTGASQTVTEDDIVGLPAPVQRYMHYSRVVGKPCIETVRLKYTGKFRMAIDKPWMTLDVTQFYRIHPPGFLWKATFKMLGMPFMSATDTFKDGKGHMVGKVAGLYTVVDGHGEEVDQGTMVRYLQEMSWFPTAYLNEHVHWQAVDDHCADVMLVDRDQHVTGRMYFDDAGRLLNFVAERYAGANGKYQFKTWSTPVTEYTEINDMMIPVAGLGVWQDTFADFIYINVRVHELQYNVPIEDF